MLHHLRIFDPPIFLNCKDHLIALKPYIPVMADYMIPTSCQAWSQTQIGDVSKGSGNASTPLNKQKKETYPFPSSVLFSPLSLVLPLARLYKSGNLHTAQLSWLCNCVHLKRYGSLCKKSSVYRTSRLHINSCFP